ncbi:MAG: hypothetical protein Q9168_004011 [Polycauliona sp. 1 TL-2023]
MNSTGPSQIAPASLILISKPTFIGLTWACVAVSFCFLVLRLFVRLRVFRRIQDDDILVILAWLMLLTCGILWHVRSTVDLVYESFYTGYGGRKPSDIQHLTNWLRILFAQLFLNIVGLWCIKYAFMALFLRLGHSVTGQKVLWWTVLALTTAGLAISVGVCYYPCIFATLEYEMTQCSKPEAVDAIHRSYQIQVGIDVATDILSLFPSQHMPVNAGTDGTLVLLIPIQLLRKVRISLKQKMGLLALFSLTIITMIFSIVRVELSSRGPPILFLCACFELTISIIMACIFSYRAYFTENAKNQRRRTKSPAGIPLNQHFESGGTEGSKEHNDSKSRPHINSEKTSEAGQDNSWSLHDLEGAEAALPRDMIGARSEVGIHPHDDT